MSLRPVALLLAFAPTIACAFAASPPPVEAAHGMVVAAERRSAEIGADILRRGGNAIDAAVAVGYAEAVANPCCGNLGGGGFLVAHLAGGRDVFIDFRETAPAAASKTMYLDAAGEPIKGASLDGWRAVATPGTVLGLDAALKAYGKMDRVAVMAPAIALARDGFVLDRADADIFDAFAARFARDPEAAKIFLRSDGSPLQPGDRLVQSDLAATLQAIADQGSEAFYRGPIAKKIDAAMRAGGGILTAADLAGYAIGEDAPLVCDYRGYRFLSAPPPSSGGATLCEILGVLEGHDLQGLGFHSAASVHLMAEAMRRAFTDRNAFLGDPAFVKNPLDRLLSKDYAARIRAAILPDKATPSDQVQPGAANEKSETTHFSVVDGDGNAVAVTYTINGGFGAGVIAPGTGFFLNDEMDDFTIKPGVANLFGLVQGEANAIAPGKRPLSSMAPTIVLKDGRIALALGSPGGSRIITATLETTVNMIDFGMSPQEAVDAPRFHQQGLPDVLYAEPYAFSPDTRRLLEAMGYKIVVQAPWSATEVVATDAIAPPGGPAAGNPDSMFGGRMRAGFLYGASDPRRPGGLAAGE